MDFKSYWMRIIRGFTFFAFGYLPLVIVSAQTSDPNATDPGSNLNYGEAVIYGLVEGVTEFLPVSSTGHLILTKEWMAADSDSDANIALNAYLIVIQAGAILAVGMLYRRDVWAIVLGVFGLDPRGRVLGRNLLLAFLPAAALGPFLDDFIEKSLLHPLPVAVALAVGALLMFWAERMRAKRERGDATGSTLGLREIQPRSALFIGVLQCVAMCPGTSRSMMTIVGGYLVGLRPAKAAEFSFLLGLVTLTAAAGYKVLTKGDVMAANLELGPIFAGCLVAGISAALAVRWLVGYLSRRGLGLFAWYRLVLAALVLIFLS
jgi:undecaprenyl-diphosphatase